MSLETTLTLGVAAALLFLGLLARAVVLGVLRLVRVIRGRPATRSRTEPAPRIALGPRARRIYEGAAALVVVAVVTVAGAFRRVFMAPRSLVRVNHPEVPARPGVLPLTSPILVSGGSAVTDVTEQDVEETREMQVV